MRLKFLVLSLFALLLSFPALAQVNPGTPIAIVHSTAFESSHILTANTFSNLYGFSVTTGAVAGYVMIFNSATVPADGTVAPVFCYYYNTNTSTGASFVQYPVPFPTGIVIVFSSTGCTTKTASATAWFTAQVK